MVKPLSALLSAGLAFLGVTLGAASPAQHGPVGRSVHLRSNAWTWTVVDDQGRPLPDVAVARFSFTPTSFSYTHQTVQTLAETFALPRGPEPLCQAVEDWACATPEAFELGGFPDVFPGVLPIPVEVRQWTDASGQAKETRGLFGQPPTGEFRLFFKPGYRPAALRYDFQPPLTSGPAEEVRVVLTPWPERQAGLASRPWIQGFHQVQLEIQEAWLKGLKHTGGMNPFPKPTFGRDPLPTWQERIARYRDQAKAAGQLRDAAWLELAAALTPFRAQGGYDATGQASDLKQGRLHQALERALALAPDVPILRARKALRDFILTSPMGLRTGSALFSLTPDIPEIAFNGNAPWTEAGLAQYFQLAAPFEQHSLDLLALTSALRGPGLPARSPAPLAEAFFRHRATLWGRLLRAYPSATWFEVGLDGWAGQYESLHKRPFLLAFPPTTR